MDLTVTCLSIGDACFPSYPFTFSQWIQSVPHFALKDFPLLGQLVTFPEVEEVQHSSSRFIRWEPPEELPLLEQLERTCEVNMMEKLEELPLFWKDEEEPQQNCMDSALWSNLPHDAIERIVAFMHVPDALRTSVVSKQWRSIMSSPTFLSLCAESSSSGSFCLVFQCGHGKKPQRSAWLAAYDPMCVRWYSMTLDFLFNAPFNHCTVVSASGGLLCLWPEPRRPSVGLVVCNPVTRRSRELPCRCQNTRMPDLVAMYVDNAAQSYKVLVLSETVSDSMASVVTELYDSTSGTWKITSVQTNLGGRFKCTVACQGMVFCLFEETLTSYKLKIYDMEKQDWRAAIPLPTYFYETQEVIETPDVLECGGRLILVGRVGKYACREEVVIWELESCPINLAKWAEMDRMPQDINKEFLGCLVFGHYYCIARGELIFFVASFKAPLLVYNLTKRSWHWWAWPFYEKYSSRFPIFGFVKPPPLFPPFGFGLDLRFDALV
eukprot:c29361_g2_i1 orf=434-1912(-)